MNKHFFISSVCMTYAILNNLPAEMRNLPQYMIIICVLPGPHEPSAENYHRVVEPIVTELKMLEGGLNLGEADGDDMFVWALVMCVACDIPALRKFLSIDGHSSYFMCSKCDKKFVGTKLRLGESVPAPDASDDDYKLNGRRRTRERHRVQGKKWLEAATDVDAEKIRKEHGFRYDHEFCRMPILIICYYI